VLRDVSYYRKDHIGPRERRVYILGLAYGVDVNVQRREQTGYNYRRKNRRDEQFGQTESAAASAGPRSLSQKFIHNVTLQYAAEITPERGQNYSTDLELNIIKISPRSTTGKVPLSSFVNRTVLPDETGCVDF
jgi:hypothetical protein